MQDQVSCLQLLFQGEAKKGNSGSHQCLYPQIHSSLSLSLSVFVKVSGNVVDAHGNEHYVIKGYWDEELNVAPVLSGEGKNKELGPFKQLWKTDRPK